jgi:hypothetical protein
MWVPVFCECAIYFYRCSEQAHSFFYDTAFPHPQTWDCDFHANSTTFNTSYGLFFLQIEFQYLSHVVVFCLKHTISTIYINVLQGHFACVYSWTNVRIKFCPGMYFICFSVYLTALCLNKLYTVCISIYIYMLRVYIYIYYRILTA